MKVVDYIELATVSERDGFVSACPFYFLVGEDTLRRPVRAQPTVTFKVPDFSDDATTTGSMPRAVRGDGPPRRLVLPVRKLQPTFPEMITVGRTANNDLVIADESVSKFHAFFRLGGDATQLVDAGSRNGTWVGALELERRGAPAAVVPGESLRFGSIELVMVDAGTLWDMVHQRR